MTLFHRWRDDVGGGVAILFGITVFVLVGAIGAAIDYSRASSVRTSLLRALDAAALTAAKNRDRLGGTPMTDEEATTFVSQTFATDKIQGLKVHINFLGDKVVVDGSAVVPTTIANVLGVKEMPVAGVSEVLYDIKAEIVLVLDNTGSMNDAGKLPTLKDAARKFLDRMQGSPGFESVKIGIVPFGSEVNLGGMRTKPWVEQATIDKWSAQPLTAGCIWDRVKPGDVSDAAPTTSDTLYGADPAKTAACILAPIVPLTANFTALRAGVEAMTASGRTNLTIGLAWGMHLLTPGEPGLGAAPVGAKTVRKYMIFMTDGLNNISRWTQAKDDSDTVAVNTLNVRTRQVCQAIRDAGIQVFAARIINGDDSVLQDCASLPTMFYPVSTVSQLEPAFDAIYRSIAGTRISR